MNSLSLQALYPADYRAPVAERFMTERIAPFSQFDPTLVAEMKWRVPDWRVVRGYPGGYLPPEPMPQDTELVERIKRLPAHKKKEVAEKAIEEGVKAGVAEWVWKSERGMGTLSLAQLDTSITNAVSAALAPMLPALQQQLVAIAEPAAKKASEVVGPVIEEKLIAWGPTMAAITGVVAAVLSVVGMLLLGGYLAKKLR